MWLQFASRASLWADNGAMSVLVAVEDNWPAMAFYGAFQGQREKMTDMALKSVTYVFNGQEVKLSLGSQVKGRTVTGMQGGVNAANGTGHAVVEFDNKTMRLIAGVPMILEMTPDKIAEVKKPRLVVPAGSIPRT